MKSKPKTGSKKVVKTIPHKPKTYVEYCYCKECEKYWRDYQHKGE